MKKILLLILTLFLFFACYYIYQITDDHELKYVLIGDNLVNNPYILKNTDYRNDFVNNDYRIIDLLRVIQYNEEILVDDNYISIHQQLREADILIISIGMNDIYYKLNSNSKDIYAYVNKMIDNLKKLIQIINKYDYKRVYFMGYYNNDDNQTLFRYLNYNIKKIANNNEICFIDTDKIIEKGEKIGNNVTNWELNDNGYKKIYNFIVENLEKC